MKKIYFSIFLAFSIISVFGQQQVFTKVFYHNQCDVTAGGIVKTPDNHYLIYGNFLWYPLIIKTDTLGNIVWSKTFTNIPSGFRTITPTHDSCFIVGGEDLFFTKINQDGDTIWTRSLDVGNVYINSTSIQETFDNGMIVSTTIQESSKSGCAVSVVKMKDSGEIEWTKKITGSETHTYNSRVQQTPDSGFILFGSSSTDHPNYTSKPILIKLTPDGDYEWAKSIVFPDIQHAEAMDMVVVEDGLGLLASLEDYATLIKTDFGGDFVWGKKSNYGINSEFYSSSFPKLNKTTDHGFIFAGGNWSGFMIKTDSNGNYQWGQDLFLYSLEAVESDDGGYLVVGNGPLYGVDKMETYGPQIGIIKTDSFGNSSDCIYQDYFSSVDIVPGIQPFTINVEQATSIASYSATPVVDTTIYIDPGCVAFIGGVAENPSEPLKLSIYPNPSDGIFQVGINKQDISGFTSLAVFNILGEKVFETADSGIFGLAIDLRAQPGGVYFVHCTMGEKVLSGRIVISD